VEGDLRTTCGKVLRNHRLRKGFGVRNTYRFKDFRPVLRPGLRIDIVAHKHSISTMIKWKNYFRYQSQQRSDTYASSPNPRPKRTVRKVTIPHVKDESGALVGAASECAANKYPPIAESTASDIADMVSKLDTRVSFRQILKSIHIQPEVEMKAHIQTFGALSHGDGLALKCPPPHQPLRRLT
jgi:hypothetical protein